MIYSMTGYGAGSHDAGKFIVETEVKSVNARSCDVRCNFPRELLALENDVRDLVKKQLIRGQISVFLKCSTEVDSLIPFDNLQIKKAVSNLKSLAKSAGLSTDGNLDTLLKFISNGNLTLIKLISSRPASLKLTLKEFTIELNYLKNKMASNSTRSKLLRKSASFQNAWILRKKLLE